MLVKKVGISLNQYAICVLFKGVKLKMPLPPTERARGASLWGRLKYYVKCDTIRVMNSK